MTVDELVKEIEAQRLLMISVSTGGRGISSVNDEYIARRERISGALRERSLEDPNPYHDLWDWYGKWSCGDLPTYQSRRQYITDLYRPLIEAIRRGHAAHGTRVFEEPTGWAKADRALTEIRKQLEQAQTEEQFQAVGLLCREALITLAQLCAEATTSVVNLIAIVSGRRNP